MILFVGLLMLLCPPTLWGQDQTLTTVTEIRNVPFKELDRGYQCEFEGIVIGVVARTERVLMQDGDQGVVVHPPLARRGMPSVGARLRVRGILVRNSVIHVQASAWEILAPSEGRPDSVPLDVPQAFTAPVKGRLIELTGLIQTIITNFPPAPSILRNRLTLRLRQGTNVISVVTPIPPDGRTGA